MKRIDIQQNERPTIINESQRISEILAVAQYEKKKTIGIDDIKLEVMRKFEYDDSEARNRVGMYYKNAINSTFLVKEQNETYRFILNPLFEYFIARRIVNDIRYDKRNDFLKHVKLIKSLETFKFIKGIIDVEWAVKPHVFRELNENENIDPNVHDVLKKYKNLSKFVFDLIDDIREGNFNDFEHVENQEVPNVKNLIRILYMTGNLSIKTNLSKLDLSGLDLSNADLAGV